MCGGFILNSVAVMELITQTTLFQICNTDSTGYFQGEHQGKDEALVETGSSTRKNTAMGISLFLILPHFYLTKFLSFAKFLSRRTTSNSFLSQSLSLSLFGLLVLKQYHFLTRLLWQTLLLAAENVGRLLHTSKEENQIVGSQRSVIFLKYFHT